MRRLAERCLERSDEVRLGDARYAARSFTSSGRAKSRSIASRARSIRRCRLSTRSDTCPSPADGAGSFSWVVVEVDFAVVGPAEEFEVVEVGGPAA